MSQKGDKPYHDFIDIIRRVATFVGLGSIFGVAAAQAVPHVVVAPFAGQQPLDPTTIIQTAVNETARAAHIAAHGTTRSVSVGASAGIGIGLPGR